MDSVAFNQPLLWEVDNPQPQLVTAALNFLRDNPEWIDKNIKQARDYCTALDNTRFAYGNLSDTDWNVYLTLLLKYPDLFSQNTGTNCMTVNSLPIPKNHLMALSKTLRHLIPHHSTNTFTLKVDKISKCRYSDRHLNLFVSFLQIRNARITQANIFSFLFLADEYGVDLLKNKCLALIEANIANYNVSELLDICIDYPLVELAPLVIKHLNRWTSQLLSLFDLCLMEKRTELAWQCLIKAYLLCPEEEVDHPLMKGLLSCPCNPFGEKVGHVIFDQKPPLPEFLSHLSSLIPLHLTLKPKIWGENFESLLKDYPKLEGLDVNVCDLHKPEILMLLNRHKNIKVFGNQGISSKCDTVEGLFNYYTDLAENGIELYSAYLGVASNESLLLIKEHMPTIKEIRFFDFRGEKQIDIEGLKVNGSSLEECSIC